MEEEGGGIWIIKGGGVYGLLNCCKGSVYMKDSVNRN